MSPAVRVVDLGIRYFEDDWKSSWNVLKGIFIMRRQHRRKVEEALRGIRPDAVVSVGQAEKFFLAGIEGGWLRVREMHYTKHYRHLAASTLLDRVMAVAGELYDYGFMIRRYDRIAVLTDEDRNLNWRGNRRVRVIPNPLSFERTVMSPLEGKTVIATGRLTAQKNFLSLVRAFRIVADRFPDWRLVILGDGGQRDMLADEIGRLSLEGSVLLKGPVKDVKGELMSASCLVLSSLFEGFGMALTEAMSCGLPVVSYSCPAGPRDIITDGVDGFLVAPGDEEGLADRICRLIGDPGLRKRMGEAAYRSSERYDLGRITAMWMDLFEGRC